MSKELIKERIQKGAAVVTLGGALLALETGCVDIKEHPVEGSGKYHVAAGTEVYDKGKGLGGQCGTVAEDVVASADHEVYGEQPLGTWGKRVAFDPDELPLKVGHTCNESFVYVDGGYASASPGPAAT